MTDEHKADSAEQDITSDASNLLNEGATAPQTAPIAPEPVAEAAPEAQPSESESDHDESDHDEHESAAGPQPHLERLQKILAQAGIASRRHAEELITEGRVQVNGQVVTVLGTKADPLRDHIRVDGKLLQGAERLRYFLFNKPRGFVTTVSDPEGRPTVMHFFEKLGERLYPVGRLDFLSEGLLLVTNDGELANNLTRAAHGVEKTYIVKVAGQPTEEMLERLRSGVAIERGRHGQGNKVRTAPARIQQIRAGQNPWFEVVLIEGRNRELRKMFEEIGHHVEKIRRVGYGPLVLDVEPGNFRELDPKEVDLLRLTAAGKIKPRRVRATYMLPKEAGVPTEERIAKEERRKKPFRPRQDREQDGERRGFGPPRDRRTAPPAGGGFTRPRTERPTEQSSTPPPARRNETSGRSFERPSRPPFAKREGQAHDRPPRAQFGKPAFASKDRPSRPRAEGDKPRGRFERPASGRPPQGRPARPPFVKREGQSQDRPPRAQFGKPAFAPKDRPSRPRVEGDKPRGRFERSASGRPPQGRPSRPPFAKREGQSHDRPPRAGFEKREFRPKPGTSRPRAESDKPRFERPAQNRPPSRLIIEPDNQSQERAPRPPSPKREPRPQERPQERTQSRPQGGSQTRPFRKDSGKPSGSSRPSGPGRTAASGRSSGAAGKSGFAGGRSKPSFGSGNKRSGSAPPRFKGKGKSGPPRTKRPGSPRGGKRPGGKRQG